MAHVQHIEICDIQSVMLNHAGEYCEYGEYCDACQAAVTIIRSSDAALKSCLEWLTMSYVIGDGAYLIFSAILLFADRPTWISLEMCTHKQRPVLGSGI